MVAYKNDKMEQQNGILKSILILVWTFMSRNANFGGEEFVLHLQKKWGNNFTWGIRSDDIECVYQSSKMKIFTNEDCSIYIDTKKEALIFIS
jgi:hypothetical protein